MNKKALSAAETDILLQYGLRQADYPKAASFAFKPGELLTREGGSLDYLYILVSGKLKVSLGLSNGKQLLLSYYESSRVIGDLELMTGNREVFTTVQAVTHLRCIGLPLNDYAPALKDNIVFLNHIGTELALKLKQRGMNSAVTILQPLEARLCAYILQTADGGIFDEKHTEVAELVGTSYRHLMRCFEKLCDHGILFKGSSGYQITDVAALKKRAGDLFLP